METHFNFLQQYTDNTEDIDFLCQFINNTKDDGANYKKLILFYGDNSVIRNVITYIQNYVGISETYGFDGFRTALKHLSYNPDKKFKLIYNFEVVERCDKTEISSIKYILDNTNVNLIANSNDPNVYFENNKSIIPRSRLIYLSNIQNGQKCCVCRTHTPEYGNYLCFNCFVDKDKILLPVINKR